MLANRASLALCIVATALLAGCSSPSSSPDSTSGPQVDASASPTATAETAVASVQPAPLIDLSCADFAGVASIGTIAGVTERDPRLVTNDVLDVVPIADIVRNAGGIACEFSDGGGWRVLDAEGN